MEGNRVSFTKLADNSEGVTHIYLREAVGPFSRGTLDLKREKLELADAGGEGVALVRQEKDGAAAYIIPFHSIAGARIALGIDGRGRKG